MAIREWNPGELLEISGFFWKTCVLQTAVKMDVFTVIGDRRLSSEEISHQLEGAGRGVERLLNALVAMELLDKKRRQICQYSLRQRTACQRLSQISWPYNYAPSPFAGILVKVGSGREIWQTPEKPVVIQQGGVARKFFNGHV
jgi:hypothetical protein